MPQQLVRRSRSTAILAGVLLVVAGTAFGALSYFTVTQAQVLGSAWSDLRREAENKQALVDNLQADLGYGGFIHSFKNYVLRGEQGQVVRFEAALTRLRSTIAEARHMDLTPAESVAVSQVKSVVDAYARNFPVAQRMRAAGASISEIDKVVRINDGPAIMALNHLRAAAEQAHSALDDEVMRLQRRRVYLWGGYGVAILLVIGLGAVLLRMIWSNLRRAQGLSRLTTGFDALFEISQDGLITLTPDLKVAGFNAAAERMFGYRADEMHGRPIDALLPERLRERHHEDLKAFAAGPDMVREMGNWRRIRGLTRDGREIPMMGAISKRHDGDEVILSVTLRDMSEAMELEDKLHQTNQAALNAARAKSRFFATVSHELRTPLNGIIGFAQAIEQQVFGPVGHEKYREYANLIQESGQKLQALVSNVIDFAALETGRQQPMLEDVDPLAVARKVLDEVATTANHKKLDCQLTGATRVAPIRVDRQGLSQVLLNLMGNAIKYTPEGGAIELQVAQEGPHTLFRISDSGVGIPAQSLYEVTEPFAQADRPDPLTAGRTTDGPGLGLAIVREIVEAHGGLLHIESEVGVGTVVSVMFPNTPGTPPTESLTGARARSRTDASVSDTSG